MTGTFDGWSKSEELDKVGDNFEKTVTLPESSGKVYYKVGPCLNLGSHLTSAPPPFALPSPWPPLGFPSILPASHRSRLLSSDLACAAHGLLGRPAGAFRCPGACPSLRR